MLLLSFHVLRDSHAIQYIQLLSLSLWWSAMDQNILRSSSVEHLLQLLLSIVLELCHRFRVPTAAPDLQPPTPPGRSSDPENPPVRPSPGCEFQRWCDRRCGRNKPGHLGHSCWDHRHLRWANGSADGLHARCWGRRFMDSVGWIHTAKTRGCPTEENYASTSSCTTKTCGSISGFNVTGRVTTSAGTDSAIWYTTVGCLTTITSANSCSFFKFISMAAFGSSFGTPCASGYSRTILG